ncbi:HD domain-containing protein [Treponema sp. OMZ 787]|uniref:CCA tRNA nucleotidyltransferase n=1 Tax=Treponema sp. OMZ 787 TaxID=2563669 RepID=UPI0020A27746|nr:HD domain-containing protein [Treponema sp. OMZ 787]UTC63271.1 HD domain-containing protein [Treponema sp. OMZ 787]
MRYPISQKMREVASILSNAGFSAYLVGGAVRDWVLGKPCKDYDIATDAEPKEVQSLFRKTIPTGIAHGTITILYKGEKIECTTFRCEADYSDGRRPDSISYVRSIEEDLSRRDFTMNAIAVSLKDGSVVDPFEGVKSIKAKIIKTVGAPLDRFGEDGLRPIRAIRFASQLGFKIEEETLKAIPLSIEVCKKVSIERFRDEFIKMLLSGHPIISFKLLEETGLLQVFLPELAGCRGVEQKGMHSFDVLDHSFLSCDAAPQDNLIVRLAALFHDIGKVSTRKMNEYGDYTFYKHEVESERLTKKIMQRLKFSNKEIEDVCHLVGLHMFHYTEDWSDAAVRRFIVRAGTENIPNLFDLRQADGFGMTGRAPDLSNLVSFKKRLEKVIAEESALSLKDLAVGGRDLMEIGIEAGPKLGTILQKLFEAVLEDPAQNTKAQLLKIAAAINANLS